MAIGMRGMMALAAALVLAACGPGVGSGAGTRPRGNAQLLMMDEIREARVSNLYDAVQRLRPAWLMNRYVGAGPGLPTVFVGSQRYGAIHALRDIDLYNVAEVHYMDAPTAASRFGRNLPFGVIQVVLDVGG